MPEQKMTRSQARRILLERGSDPDQIEQIDAWLNEMPEDLSEKVIERVILAIAMRGSKSPAHAGERILGAAIALNALVDVLSDPNSAIPKIIPDA